MSELEVQETGIAGLWLVTLKSNMDARGTIREFYRRSALEKTNLPSLGAKSQLNFTSTHAGAVRGIHAEAAHKYVSVAYGEVEAVILDPRPKSPTFGSHYRRHLQLGQGLFVSAGLGNSFQSLTESVYVYIFSEEWTPDMPGLGFNPLDPALRIDWPLPIDPTNRAQISAKDAGLPTLAEAVEL